MIAHQRYAHAKQFKRANRQLRALRTYLGRVRRDIMRKIKGDAAMQAVFAQLLSLSRGVLRTAPEATRQENLFAARP